MSGEASNVVIDGEAEPIVDQATDEAIKDGEGEVDGSVDVVIDGEEKEDAPAAKPRKNVIRDMRQRIKRGNDENKVLRDRLSVLEEVAKTGGKPRDEFVAQPATAPTARPSLADMNYDTDKYEAAMESYMSGTVDRALDKRLSTARQSDVTNEAESAISGHYERASELGVGDFEEMEDSAIETLGAEVIQSIQATVDQSEMLIYYLGKNPAKASKLRKVFDSNPAKATFELGTLAAKLVLKPTGKAIPEPDLTIDGGGGGVHPKYNEYINKITKAYDAGDLGAARAIRKEATEKGVELPYNSI